MHSMKELKEIYDLRKLVVCMAFFAVPTEIVTVASYFLAEVWCPEVKYTASIVVFMIMLTFFFAVYGPWACTKSVNPQWGCE